MFLNIFVHLYKRIIQKKEVKIQLKHLDQRRLDSHVD